MKLSKNFVLAEFVHPEFIKVLGDRSALLISPRLVETYQALRDQLQTPIKINDWHNMGRFKFSGLRPLYSTEGAKKSIHKTGRAADGKFQVPAEKVYYHILNNQTKYPFISRMENIEHTPTWVHIEVSYEPREGEIYLFNP